MNDAYSRFAETLAPFLEAVDPEAAYWIPELNEDPEHISVEMLRQLRIKADEGGLCFGHEEYNRGPLGFWPKVPWLYRLLRQHEYRAADAYEICQVPHIELGPMTKTITNSVLPVRLQISQRCRGTAVSRSLIRAMRRKGASSQDISDLRSPGHIVRLSCQHPEADRTAIFRLVPGNPYLDSAAINLVAMRMVWPFEGRMD